MGTVCSYYDFKVLNGKGRGPRRGIITFRRGTIQTPAFFPVASLGTVKGITPEEILNSGYQGLLMNAYHIFIRLDIKSTVGKAGGLHKYTNFPGFIITDSGGFQVKSLSDKVSVKEEGIYFSSPIDGSVLFFSPEKVVEIQENLDSDVKIPLDVCPSYPSEEDELRFSSELTLQWLKRAKNSQRKKEQAFFGIIQGGFDRKMRKEYSLRTVEMDFDGYAIGGLSVGEPKDLTFALVEEVVENLPSHKIRYLMGMGKPWDIVSGVDSGIDIFDCVIPTREARNGTLYTWSEGKISIKTKFMRKDLRPIDENCECYACKKGFSRSFLSHLYKSGEMLALRLLTLHNLQFYSELMRKIRQSLEKGNFGNFKRMVYNIFKEDTK